MSSHCHEKISGCCSFLNFTPEQACVCGVIAPEWDGDDELGWARAAIGRVPRHLRALHQARDSEQRSISSAVFQHAHGRAGLGRIAGNRFHSSRKTAGVAGDGAFEWISTRAIGFEVSHRRDVVDLHLFRA